MSLVRTLVLRTEFEELTQDFNMPEGSHIDSIDWFLENGHRSNSLRNGFNDAYVIAQIIIKEHCDGRSTNERTDSGST